MTDNDNSARDEAPLNTDPPGGHSRAALDDAEKKMGVNKSEDAGNEGDPSGEHDRAALADARKKMGDQD